MPREMLERRAAITGIGQSDVGRRLGRGQYASLPNGDRVMLSAWLFESPAGAKAEFDAIVPDPKCESLASAATELASISGSIGAAWTCPAIDLGPATAKPETVAQIALGPLVIRVTESGDHAQEATVAALVVSVVQAAAARASA